MEYARLELRLSGAPSGAKVTVAGAVGGQVLGALVQADGGRIVQTVLASRTVRQLNLAAVEDDSGAVLIAANTHVLIGKQRQKLKLRRLWVDRASGQITHFLLAPAGLTASGAERVAAAAAVERISTQGIVLHALAGGANALPLYRDDAAIAGDVGVALEQTLLDPRSRRSVHARVEDGHVEYSGLLDTQDQVGDLLAATRRIPGVRGVRSDIVATELLAAQVVAALDDLQAKGTLSDAEAIEVLSEHQIVHLVGQVQTAKARDAAERAALGVNGVRLVVNELTVEGPALAPPADPASPRTKLK